MSSFGVFVFARFLWHVFISFSFYSTVRMEAATGLTLEPLIKARDVCQKAEHQWAKVPCGEFCRFDGIVIVDEDDKFSVNGICDLDDVDIAVLFGN